MSADTRQRRVEELLAPSLGPDEQLVTSGGAWYVSVPPGHRRLFAGRHYQLVALTSERVVVWSRRAHPHRHSTPRLDVRLDSVQIDRGRNSVLLQLLVRTEDGATQVLELRPRQRALGRAIADAIGGATTGATTGATAG
jgi:hypothetical protein